MRKVTEQVVRAFLEGRTLKVGNTKTEKDIITVGDKREEGQALYLHGNAIARRIKLRPARFALYITNAGWATNTTKERLNGLPGVSITQKNWTWYLNGKEWDGKWIRIN